MANRNTQDDRVLDAAHATVLDFGVRRATLTEVARRAGLSRMTLYRRFADAPELMRALMSREFGEVLLSAQEAAAATEDPLAQIVAAITGTISRLVEHPLLLRLLELEPEVLMPYLAIRVGEFQQGARTALARWIADAQLRGAVRAGDPELMAETVELLARGPVIASRSLSGARRMALVAELETALRAYLQPESQT
jgi:AcrR family transcriptional regulator